MTTTLTRIALAFAALVLGVPAFGAPHSSFYVVPVVSHVRGATGTFVTDLVIHNFNDRAIHVDMIVLESGEGRLDNFSPIAFFNRDGEANVVSAGSTEMVTDVLRSLSDRSGALLIGADGPFAVTTRNYAASSSGTFGTTVPAVSDFLENAEGTTDLAEAVAYLPGLVSNDRYRTNLGLAAASSTSSTQPLIVEITLRDGRGATAGTRRLVVEQGTAVHTQYSIRDLSASTFDVASAEARIVSGSGAVVPYAAIVDNRSSDASLVVGTFPPNRSLSNSFASSTFAAFLRNSLRADR